MSTEDDQPTGPVAGEGVTEEPGGEPARRGRPGAGRGRATRG